MNLFDRPFQLWVFDLLIRICIQLLKDTFSFEDVELLIQTLFNLAVL